MKPLLIIFLACLTTILTLLVMPALDLMTAQKPQVVRFHEINAIQWKQDIEKKPPEPTLKTPPKQQKTQPEPPPEPQPFPPPPSPESTPPPPPPPELSLALADPLPTTISLDAPSLNLDLAVEPSPLEAIPETLPPKQPKPPKTPKTLPQPTPRPVPQKKVEPPPPVDTPLREKVVVKPAFPRNTRQLNGSVELQFTVNADGSISNVTVIKCDSHLSFKYQRAAIRAAQRSTYFPPTKNGKPVSVQATRRIDFIIP